MERPVNWGWKFNSHCAGYRVSGPIVIIEKQIDSDDHDDHDADGFALNRDDLNMKNDASISRHLEADDDHG